LCIGNQKQVTPPIDSSKFDLDGFFWLKYNLSNLFPKK
jgi:hypothetical protein